MTNASDLLMGYGDYNFSSAGTKAYIIDLEGGNVLALAWNNGAMPDSNTSCGSYTAGALYKMKIISGGFEVYKNGRLLCSLSTSFLIDDKPIWFQASGSAATADNVVVYGLATSNTVPDAPTAAMDRPQCLLPLRSITEEALQHLIR